MNFEEVLDRIAEIVEKDIGRKPYDKDIAKALEIAPAQYSNNKKQQNIPIDKIAAYCGRKRVSISWVLFEQSSAMLEENTEAIFKVRLLKNINAGAGGEAFNDDNEEFTYLSVDRLYMDRLGITDKDKIEAINVVGDSMEDTLKEGSIILINRDRQEIMNGGIFVVNTPGGVLVKRVSINPVAGIDLISDNKSYPVTTVPLGEITVIGKVIGALEKI